MRLTPISLSLRGGPKQGYAFTLDLHDLSHGRAQILIAARLPLLNFAQDSGDAAHWRERQHQVTDMLDGQTLSKRSAV